MKKIIKPGYITLTVGNHSERFNINTFKTNYSELIFRNGVMSNWQNYIERHDSKFVKLIKKALHNRLEVTYIEDLPEEEFIFYSDRNTPLTYVGGLLTFPLVCVELYQKWYSLYIIQPSGQVVKLTSPPTSPDGTPLWIDHVPNPTALNNWLESEDLEICELSMELIIGRYEQEVKGKYGGD